MTTMPLTLVDWLPPAMVKFNVDACPEQPSPVGSRHQKWLPDPMVGNWMSMMV